MVTATRRDRGSTLVLVLVLVVIGALIVIPLLNYAVSVFRAGEVEADKARAVELSRSGLRTALASTRSLYEGCGDSVFDGPRNLSSVGLPGVASTCQVIATANYRDTADVPYHVGVVQVDQTVPASFDAPGRAYPNPNTPAGGEANWHADATVTSTQSKVWTPNLPGRPDSARTTSTDAPDSYGRAMSFSTCDVYFPGTYEHPIEISGPRPAYFVSGIYYFESTITFDDGVSAVVGGGRTEGCTSDLDALTYVTNPPSSAHISGVGATFVFGTEGRMIVDNSGGPVSVDFNQRYVDDSETGVLSSEGVSIVTVNGDLDDSNALIDLFAADVISVKAGNAVDTDGNAVLATDFGYLPSTHTPKPIPPEAPTAVVVSPVLTLPTTEGGVTVEWSPPDTSNDGLPITKYQVLDVATETFGCTTVAPDPDDYPSDPWNPVDQVVPLSCTVEGLSTTSDYEFFVIAENAAGESPASVPSNTVTGAMFLDAWTEPTEISVSVVGMYDEGLEVEWIQPLSPDDGRTPITRYTVTAVPTLDPTNPTASCTVSGSADSCLLAGLAEFVPPPAPPAIPPDPPIQEAYSIEVIATNVFGDSPSATTPLLASYVTPAVSNPLIVPVPPEVGVRIPEPIIDVTATSTDRISLSIAGYISMPQGRLHVDGGTAPDTHDIELIGGMLAARVDVENEPSTMRLELVNPATQKTIRIVTTVSGDYRAVAEAIVQVNDNFGWSLNSWQVR